MTAAIRMANILDSSTESVAVPAAGYTAAWPVKFITDAGIYISMQVRTQSLYNDIHSDRHAEVTSILM